jgi:HK97 family phage portal protein
MSLWTRIVEKLNPAQHIIAEDEGRSKPTTQTKIRTITNAYDLVEIVNRCVNLIVDNASLVNYDVGDSLNFTGLAPRIKPETVNKLLNHRPNPYMDKNTFRRLLLMDFLIDGNAFIYFDGTALYHIPAARMEIVPDDKGLVSEYIYGNEVSFKPREIIHVRDNSLKSVLRGDSRINSALETILSREAMLKFQESFFKNGTVMGVIIEVEEILSAKMKERQEREWMSKFNPTNGGAGRPLILDNNAKAKTVSNSNFKDMGFDTSIEAMDKRICIALGVPHILIDSGNNANIKPNLELMFYTTILPLLVKFESALEYYFAFDIELSTFNVPALKPDKEKQAKYLTSLVNNGLMLGSEARKILRLPELDDPLLNHIRIPANVSGSASAVSGQEGGAPSIGDNTSE